MHSVFQPSVRMEREVDRVFASALKKLVEK